MKDKAVSVFRGRMFSGFVVIVAVAAGLAGCGPPPPNELERFVTENCAITKIEKRGLGCKGLTWSCPNGLVTQTTVC